MTTPSRANKSVRYTGIQPQYFPRLHYFNRILNTDQFMVRDEVQFVKKHKYPDGHNGPSFQAHTPIKSASGLYLLNIPFVHDGQKPIFKTKVSYESVWPEEHLKSISFAYGKAPFFKEIYPDIETIILKRHDTIAGLNLSTIYWALGKLLGAPGINATNLTLAEVNKLLDGNQVRLKRIKLGSKSDTYKILSNPTPNEKIVSLIKEVGADHDYCGGTASDAYMDHGFFKSHGIEIEIQDWKCPEYPQLFNKNSNFISNLSIIDLFMNYPTDKARTILID